MSTRDPVIEAEDSTLVRNDLPHYAVGDTVKVHHSIVEGKKERIQVIEYLVMAKKGRQMTRSFIGRHILGGCAMERLTFVNHPSVKKIEVVRRGVVARNKLYYMRNKLGRAAKVKGLIFGRK